MQAECSTFTEGLTVRWGIVLLTGRQSSQSWAHSTHPRAPVFTEFPFHGRDRLSQHNKGIPTWDCFLCRGNFRSRSVHEASSHHHSSRSSDVMASGGSSSGLPRLKEVPRHEQPTIITLCVTSPCYLPHNTHMNTRVRGQGQGSTGDGHWPALDWGTGRSLSWTSNIPSIPDQSQPFLGILVPLLVTSLKRTWGFIWSTICEASNCAW